LSCVRSASSAFVPSRCFVHRSSPSFLLSSELTTNPFATAPLTPASSEADVERQRKIAYKKYLAERKAAKGDDDDSH
jgi:hypothetical protein